MGVCVWGNLLSPATKRRETKTLWVPKRDLGTINVLVDDTPTIGVWTKTKTLLVYILLEMHKFHNADDKGLSVPIHKKRHKQRVRSKH